MPNILIMEGLSKVSKLLIIDDEPNIFKAVRIMLKSEELGITEIFEAISGEKALNIIRSQRPEITMLDMKMPIMDGVEFLKKAKSIFPQGKYIILSGYDDFQYTHTAILNGVVDYLLKPLNEDSLNDVIKKSLRQIEDEKLQKKNLLNSDTVIVATKHNILRIIREGSMSQRLSESFSHVLGIDGANLRLVYFKLKKVPTCKTNVLENSFAEIPDLLCWEYDEIGHQILVLFSCPSNESNKSDNRIKKVISSLNCLAGLDVITIISAACKLIDLHSAYSKCLEAIDNLNIMNNYQNIISLPMNPQGKDIIEYSGFSDPLFKAALVTGNYEACLSFINKLKLTFKETGYLSVKHSHELYNNFIDGLFHIIQNSLDEGIRHKAEILTEIPPDSSFYSFDAFIYLLQNKITQALQFFFVNATLSQSDIAAKIREDILNNYYKEITLKTYVDMFFLTREYIQRIFKNETGFSLHQYIIKVRMEKAVELLKNPSIKIINISTTAGYNNISYFSKAFYLYYGVTPSQYRELL